MTACCQITCAIPRLSCEQLPYLPEHPRIVKSPAQSLDYNANSYHIYLNTLGFYGCGKEISQIYPCPPCPINTSFSGTLLPPYHSTASYPPFWWRHCSRNSRTPFKDLPRQPSRSSSSFSFWEKMAINFVVPEVNLITPFLLYTFIVLLSIHESIYWVQLFFFVSFSVPPTFNPFRNWLIRLWFLLINPTFTVSAHWEIQMPPIW